MSPSVPAAPRILIVEDEAVVALHLGQMLRRLNYIVLGAVASGEEALAKIADLRPDIVLMDIHIQGDMDGIKTASRIPLEINTAVIYVTAFSEDDTLARARLTRPYGFIIKPFSERGLHVVIQTALERHRVEVELRSSEQRLEQANRKLAAEIAERERIADALRSSQENLRSFFELSPQAPWVAGPDGKGLEVSPRFLKLTMLKDAQEAWDSWSDIVCPDDYEAVRDTWRACLVSGNPLDHEYRIKTPGRDYRWFRTRAFSQRDDSGQIRRWFGVLEDIHDRKLAQTALQDSEQRLRLIYEESPIGIVLMHAENGRIVQLNPAAARSIEAAADEAVGKSFLEFVKPADGVSGGLMATAVERQWSVMERSFVTRSGKTLVARIRLSLLPHVAGRIDMILGLSEDITDQRRVEAALAQAQKMEAIGELTGGLAHDFNNLLGVIIGNLDMLRTIKPDDQDTADLGGEAMAAALRGADLVRRLLAFARRQPLHPTTFDVNEAVGEIVKLLRRTLGQNIEIAVNEGTGVWPVIADRLQFETAVTNLATNARDAMPGGGRLTIGTGNRHLDADYAAGHPELSPGDYVMIEVTDNGTGMSPELMAQVFQPFFTTKEPGKGSGLGLSMVFGYAKQSRGHVNAYSEPGAGTTFRLYLPRSFEQCLTRDQLVTPGEFPIGRGETILVVEDNAALRRIAVRQIRSLGYRVVEAAGAAEALAMLGREGVDLLFTDVVMPGGMDGFALAQATRIRWPAMRILLTSGFPASELLEAYEVSGYRVLNKPYIKDDLAQLLRAALN